MNVIPMERKLCQRTQKYLDAYINNELLVETNQEVLKHLEICKLCSEALQVRLRVKSRLKQAVQAEVVPAGLRERIRAAIREGNLRDRKTIPWTHWSLAAAAVLVMLLGGWATLQVWKLQQTSNEASPLAQQLSLSEQVAAILRIGVGDHIQCVIESGYDTKVMTPEQMAAKMGPEYLGLVPLLKEKLPERFGVSAGHRCHANDREFIHMVLKHEDQVVSVIITEKQGVSFPAGSRENSVEAQGVALYQDRLQSLEAVGFETQEYLAFVISALDHKDTFQIASQLAPAVSGFLNKL